MGTRMRMRKRLFGLVIAMAAVFCIAGGMAITAFAQPQQAADGQDMAAGSAELAAQGAGDVSYRYYDTGANDFQTGTKASGEYTLVAQDSTTWGESGAVAWYVVSGKDVQIGGRVTVAGTVNLILCDGATLTASKGITVASGNTLNIYPGSTKSTVAGMGRLYAGCQLDGDTLTVSCDSSAAGIGDANGGPGGGEVAIHGGAVTAIGGASAAGIGGGGGYYADGGTFAIYGGTVTATGGESGAGIGGGYVGNGGTVAIYGGDVTATGGEEGAGIGGGTFGSGGTVTVHGGTVNATGGYKLVFDKNCAGAGIGGGRGGNGGAVTISGGSVNATAGYGNVAGIGGGSTDSGSANPGALTLGRGVTLYGGTSVDPETPIAPAQDGSYARYQYMKTTSVSSIRYQAWDSSSGTAQTVANGISEYTQVENSTTSWNGGSNDGWYVVSGSVAIADRITVSGTVNLILCNDATLTASKGITVGNGSTLNIYAQGTGENKGRLIAGASSDGCAGTDAGIGGSGTAGGTVVIHGGAVTAIGGASAAGIGGGNGAAGGAVTIYGGAVNTAGGEGAMGIGAGANATGGNGGLATPGAGVTMIVSSDGNEWSLYGTDRARYMKTAATFSVALTGGGHATYSGDLTQTVTESQAMTEVTFTAEGGYHFVSFDELSDSGIKVTWVDETTVKVSGTPSGNASITIPDAVQIPVPYQAWDKASKTVKNVEGGCTSYTVVNSSTTAFEDGQWYVASGNVTIDDRITVSGTAHLILSDNVTLTASKGITVASGNTLNIYPGSTGDNVAGTGRLYAGCQLDGNILTVSCDSSAAGIGGISKNAGGTVNIHGGAVTATGGVGGDSSGGAAGIGGGYYSAGGVVTVYGGTVTANGGNFAAGIGSGDGAGWLYDAGTFTIHGGTVTATGGMYGAGIGGGRNGDHGGVNIHGGTVTAKGGDSAAGIGSGAYVNDYSYSTRSTVTISGGTVIAKGGEKGAGIGGGNSGNSGAVTISGGTVTATGGKQAAGIGGGTGRVNSSSGSSVFGNCGKVTINGGTVTATGGERAAGIGGGMYGNGGEVIVNGGTVKATGSVGVHNSNVIAGIGGGDYAESLTTSGTLELGQGVALYGGDSSEATLLRAAEPGLFEGARDTYMEATGAAVQPVLYQAWDAESGTVKDVTGGRSSYTVVDTSTTAFGDGKWYVVSGDVTVSERITVTGEAHLILCDDFTLTANKGVYVPYSDENNDGKSDNILNIYAQSGGKSMGALTATGELWAAGIGGGSENAGGTVNIHGGTVTANGGMYGAAGIGGGSGGDGGTVAIYGGLVTANGGSQAAGIGHGANSTDNGTLTLAGTTLPMVVSDDNVHWSAYNTTEDNRAQYMKPAGTVSVTLTVGAHATYTGTLEQTVAEGAAIVAVTFTADAGYVFEKFTPTTKNGITMTWTDEKTITVSGAPTATTEITIPNAVPAPITYKAWDETAQEMKNVNLGSGDYHVVDANTKKLAVDDKPYVVSSDVTIPERIALEGNSAELIICDGATLTASQGIKVASTDTLNIYPGSIGDSVEGTGTLKATGSDNYAGIGNGEGFDGGTVVIHGGNVEAKGGANAAGIGSGSRDSGGTATNCGCNVTVYGGTVKATGSASSAGIGAGDYGTQHGTLTLNEMALYGGASEEEKALIIGSLNGGHTGNRYAYMEIGPAVDVKPIPYRAWNEEYGAVLDVDGGCTSYIAMDANTPTIGDGNWYVVSDNLTVQNRITVSGTAHLIICDGATLTASKGISTTGGTLNIYTQSSGESAGKLVAGAASNGCSDYVAAIGGGNTESGGTLNIHGGTVTAIGGRLAAGIGGGYHGNGGTINLYTGNVTATGGEKAAGIGGGGDRGNGATFTIYGATVTKYADTVTATGGQGAAGIGGGTLGSGGTLTIRGGTVTATGGEKGAGIGGGSQGDGGNVNISGGTVITAAGEGAEGIGSGDGVGAHGALTIGTNLALYGGDSPNFTALANKDVIQSVTYYERSRYMTVLDAVKGVEMLIGNLPAPDKVTLADKEAIMSAREAYDALTAAQKAKVSAEALKKLEAAEAALAKIEKDAADTAAADAVTAKINALPEADKVTTADKAAIQEARTAYNALTDDQKAKVPAEALKKLEAAEQALAKAEEAASGNTMYRLYNPNSGEHFFTSDEKECNDVVAAGWNEEGMGWKAPATSDTPVFRLYNPNAGEHHYTTDADERDWLVGLGWKSEGIGWYSDDAKSKPLYRLYNPNEFANNHHYTTDTGERDWLVGLGWRDEGIGWYGLS